MKKILLMRHGLADTVSIDFERALLPEGWQQVQDIALQLRSLLPKIDTVLCSTSRRTRETLEGLGIQQTTPVQFEDQLYHAPADFMLKRLQLLDERVHFPSVIGHNPGMDQFIREITGAEPNFLPACAALLTTDKLWKELHFRNCHLIAFYRPQI